MVVPVPGELVNKMPAHRRTSWYWLVAVVLTVLVLFLLYGWAASKAT